MGEAQLFGETERKGGCHMVCEVELGVSWRGHVTEGPVGYIEHWDLILRVRECVFADDLQWDNGAGTVVLSAAVPQSEKRLQCELECNAHRTGRIS